MLELVVAVITGWLAFLTTNPTADSFGSFLLFFVVWIVYFIIALIIVRSFTKKSNDIPAKPKIDFSSSSVEIWKSIYGNYVYPERRLELLNREIKKNLFDISIRHPEIDFIYMWLLYEDDFGHIVADIAPNKINLELKNKISFIIRATVIKFETDNPQSNEPYFE
jgi:hypothetical protein